MADLCSDCRAHIHAWEDTKPSVVLAGGLTFTAGTTSRDASVVGVLERRQRRWQDWRDLVVSQSDLIRGICARQHQAGQVALFELGRAA